MTLALTSRTSSTAGCPGTPGCPARTGEHEDAEKWVDLVGGLLWESRHFWAHAIPPPGAQEPPQPPVWPPSQPEVPDTLAGGNLLVLAVPERIFLTFLISL